MNLVWTPAEVEGLESIAHCLYYLQTPILGAQRDLSLDLMRVRLALVMLYAQESEDGVK